VQVASTKPSLAFFSKTDIEAENEGVYVWTDEDEWAVSEFFDISSMHYSTGISLLLLFLISHGQKEAILSYTLN